MDTSHPVFTISPVTCKVGGTPDLLNFYLCHFMAVYYSGQLRSFLGLSFLICRMGIKYSITGLGLGAKGDDGHQYGIFFYKFIYFWLCWVYTWAFSSCGERGLLFAAVRGLLIAVASLVVEHGL